MEKVQTPAIRKKNPAFFCMDLRLALCYHEHNRKRPPGPFLRQCKGKETML